MNNRHISNILNWDNEKSIIISASKLELRDDDFEEFYKCVMNSETCSEINRCKDKIRNQDLKDIICRINTDDELDNFKESTELLKFFHNKHSIYSNNWINMVLCINKNNVADVTRYSKILANEFNQIPSSKLRKFYDYVLKIYENKNSNWYVELYRLKSFIAYNIGKETSPGKKNALRKFSKIFEKLIDEIDGDDKKFDNFKSFFESVVAYHRAYNEK